MYPLRSSTMTPLSGPWPERAANAGVVMRDALLSAGGAGSAARPPGDDAEGHGIPRERPAVVATGDRRAGQRAELPALLGVRGHEELLHEPPERTLGILVGQRDALEEPHLEQAAAREQEREELAERGQGHAGLAVDGPPERLGRAGGGPGGEAGAPEAHR